jgi:hypothetical protein
VKIREGDHVATIKLFIPCSFTILEKKVGDRNNFKKPNPALTDVFPMFWVPDHTLDKRLEERLMDLPQ